MFKICGINLGEFILDGKPLAEKGAAVKETVVINSVARKVDVDKEILPPNKLNYFQAVLFPALCYILYLRNKIFHQLYVLSSL